VKKLVTLLLPLLFTTNVVASDMCLIRTEPTGAPDVLQVTHFVEPVARNILIHSEKQQACVPGTYCHVAKGDELELVKTNAGYTATWTHRPKTSASMKTVIKLKPKVAESGMIMLAGRRDQTTYYLVSQGERECRAVGNYAAGERCNFYRFEVFPDSVNGYIKPDASASEFPGKIEWRTPCINAQQPGGGDGHETPPPKK
jgi:hypothetical protein